MSGRVPVRDDLVDVVPYGVPQLDVPVRLNTNETPQPPSTAYLDAVAARVRGLELQRYPDRRVGRLRERLGALHGLPASRVWAANGSNEVLLQLFQAYGGAGRRLLLFRPGYSAHPLIARVSGTEVVVHDLGDDFALDPATAADAVERHDPAVVCVARPDNPSGALHDPAAIRVLHDHSRALVIVDEAYVEFAAPRPSGHGHVAADDVLAASAVSLRPALDELERLVVTRTFSKAFRLAGLRLGYLLAHDWVVDDLRRVRLPYHLSTLTQAAAETALDHRTDLLAHIPAVASERDRVAAALAASAGVTRVWPSAANFVLFRSPATALFDRLLARGVLVRDFSTAPRLAGCLRVSVGTPREDDAFLAALASELRHDVTAAHTPTSPTEGSR